MNKNLNIMPFVVKLEGIAHVTRGLHLLEALGCRIHEGKITAEEFVEGYGDQFVYFEVKADGYVSGYKNHRPVDFYYPKDLGLLVNIFCPTPRQQIKIPDVAAREAVVSHRGIKIGCQLVPFAKFYELAEAVKKVTSQGIKPSKVCGETDMPDEFKDIPLPPLGNSESARWAYMGRAYRSTENHNFHYYSFHTTHGKKSWVKGSGTPSGDMAAAYIIEVPIS